MSMNTYPLEEKCALVVTPALAAAMQIQYLIESGATGQLHGDIRAALEAGLTSWQCTSDPNCGQILHNDDYDNISDAFDLLQSLDSEPMVHCSEFTGQASVPDAFRKYGGQDISFEDDFFACLSAMSAPGLFGAAYESPDALAKEYRGRLEGLVSPDTPIERFILDVSGTYAC